MSGMVTTAPPSVAHEFALPQELTDDIIDHLHSDRSSLLNCSLVCKTWTPAARYHLFECTSLSLEHSVLPLREFDECLSNGLITASCIKTFKLFGSGISDSDDSVTEIPEAALASVLSKLVRVRRVGLGKLCVLSDDTDIVWALATLPELHTIWLSDLRLSSGHTHHTPSAIPVMSLQFGRRASLKTLVFRNNLLEDARLQSFMDAFADHMKQVGRLFLTLPTRGSETVLPLYNNILARTSTTLIRLSLDLREWSLLSVYAVGDSPDPAAFRQHYQDVFKPLSLAACTQVQELEIWIEDPIHFRGWVASSVILDMMPRAGSLRELVIAVGHKSQFGLPGFEEGIMLLDEAAGRLSQLLKITLTRIRCREQSKARDGLRWQLLSVYNFWSPTEFDTYRLHFDSDVVDSTAPDFGVHP